MDDGAVKTLFLPFENGGLPPPAQGARFLFLNAAVPPSTDHDWTASLDCVQGFRPGFLALQASGFRVAPEMGQATYSGALALLGKHRELNRSVIYAALEKTLPGGPVVIAGAKTSGVQAMRKELAELAPVERSLSKNHAQVFWCNRPENWVSPPTPAHETIASDGMRFMTAPGMFSYRRADTGSQMLARHLADVKGKAADFGAGWGYLSAMLLKTAPGVTALDLIEADFTSLEAARTNLRDCASRAPIAFHWQDLLAEPVRESYDAIIMNPPFHTGRSAEASIGQRMIDAAARCLKPGGRLLMVANKELPYEDTLQRAFRRFERIDQDRQYKVINAVK